jgi:hypothetical protein
LNPAAAHELGFLEPDSKWTDNLGLLLAASPHGAANGLWIGPGKDGAIAAGLFTSPAAIQPILLRYGAHAASILYPYPRQYAGASDHGDDVHFLLMTLNRDVLEQACRVTSAHSP